MEAEGDEEYEEFIINVIEFFLFFFILSSIITSFFFIRKKMVKYLVLAILSICFFI